MNWLQWSLRTLKQVYPDGPYREAPWVLVKCDVSLAKCRCSVRFLTACRRYGVLPNFVRNCSKASKLFGTVVLNCEKKFQQRVLNCVISEKFRYINRLHHERMAAIKEVHKKMSLSDAKWSFGHSRVMSGFVAHEESRRLRSKLDSLLEEKRKEEEKEKVDGESPEVRYAEKADTIKEAQDRRVVVEEGLSEIIPEAARELLALGPKFVPRRRVSDAVVREAELGVERLAFGKRWQVENERRLRTLAENDRAGETNHLRGEEAGEDAVDGRSLKILDEDVRLRKLTVTRKQGPLMEAKDENALKRLKENVVKLYNQARSDQRKTSSVLEDSGRLLTRKERESLAELRADSRITIKPSDKSKGFVVMSSASYTQKVVNILECPDNDSYERCSMTVEELEKQTKSAISTIVEDKLPAKLASRVTPHNSRMSQFYGLPKDHKEGLPLRPVVSTCGSAMSNISLVLERILNQLLRFVPAHLSSTAECVEELRRLGQLPEICIIASLDVVGLYANIPIDESIDAVIELLDAHQQQVDMFELSLSDVRQLLEFVLNSNYFAFGNEVYRQRKGLAMGNHLAPPLAIIFMSKLETEALSLSPYKPQLYRRYIDDCITVWLHGLALLLEFVAFMNSRHPDIKFTIEHTGQNELHTVSYLDLSISVLDGIVNWELFIKFSHSGVHLAYSSSLPGNVKRSVAVEQFRRANRNASTKEGRIRGEQKIETLLRQNGFPPAAIRRAKQQASARRQRSDTASRDAVGTILKLPFVDDSLAEKIRRTVRAYSRDVRVVFTSGKSLKNMLVSTSLAPQECPKVAYSRKVTKGRGRPPECRACDSGIANNECMERNVVYSMFCSLCGAEYVGETERHLRDRFQEHYRQARTATANTPWGVHYSLCHKNIPPPKLPFQRATVLTRAPDFVNRRILEAILIRDRHPRVNSDCGWRLV